MFTGLVEEVAIVQKINHRQHSAHLHIAANKVLEGARLGDSIAVNGACLTVVDFSASGFTADAVPETMRKTNLGHLHPGDRVNVERALQLGARLGGHMVAGHVDGVGVIRAREGEGIATVFTIDAAADLLRYVVDKGSICVNGVSLTVMDSTVNSFRLSIIPHTGTHTTLMQAKVGDIVNLECDLIAKYVEKMLFHTGGQQTSNQTINGGQVGSSKVSGSRVDLDYLRQHGFA